MTEQTQPTGTPQLTGVPTMEPEPEIWNQAEMPAFTFDVSTQDNEIPPMFGKVVLFRDQLGNLIVCEPEYIPSAKWPSTTGTTSLPSVSEKIPTIDTTINTTGLQEYTIFEGTDGSKYLSPSTSASWAQQQTEPPSIQVHPSPQPSETLFYGGDEEEELETPTYKLDHMYARKPDEEARGPVRKRARKSSIRNEIVIQESSEGSMETQKLDVVSPTPSSVVSLPNPSGISRPRILNTREGANSKEQAATVGNSAASGNGTPPSKAPDRTALAHNSTSRKSIPTGMIWTKSLTVIDNHSKTIYKMIARPEDWNVTDAPTHSMAASSTSAGNLHSLSVQYHGPPTEKYRRFHSKYIHMTETVFKA